MRIRNRFIVLTSVIGIVSILLISFALRAVVIQSVIEEEKSHFNDLSELAAYRLESDFYSIIRTVTTLANSEIIRDELLKSNEVFELLDEQERLITMENLNSDWISDSESSEHLKDIYMNEPASLYLQKQRMLFNDWYGEILLTDRSGMAVAMTDPDATLSHNQNFWWKSAFNQGKGKNFIDDRGFDNSINDYMLGVAIPVYHENQVIGILKANVNISDLLDRIIKDFNGMHDSLEISIIRSGGLIVYDKKESPLTDRLDDSKIEMIKIDSTEVTVTDEYLYASSPVSSTFFPVGFAFRGSKHTVDYSLGTNSEGWHVFMQVERAEILQEINLITYNMIVIDIGIIFIVILVGALMIVRSLRPMKDLVDGVAIIGNGNLDYKFEINSEDEIGDLADAINKMTTHLKETTISKRNLEEEMLQRIKVEEELYRLSNTDELTEINNRRAFKGALENAISRNERYQETFSLLMIDVDFFKTINDRFGHGRGDQVLIELSQFLTSAIRKVDCVARWGGEEFIILMPLIEGYDAFQVAERLRKDIMGHRFAEIEGIKVSIGVTENNGDEDMDSIVSRVDKALYQAKENGRNNTIIL